MLDEDLAELYQVETKNLNKAVKRNLERFPDKFRFQLTREEFENLKFQFGTSSLVSLRFQNGTSKKEHGGRRKLPYVFTEQGVSMLSAVLRSDVAVRISIQIIDAFVEMRKFLAVNASVFGRLDSLELKQLEQKLDSDKKFNQLFDALESGDIKPKQGIFYDGQVFDACVFVSKIVKSAKKSIILIDNFVDESVLQLLTKRAKGVKVVIYTKNISKVLKQDLEKHNSQYEKIEIKKLKKAHDRFLIIDKKIVYHFGASLKDLGTKWFGFSKLEMSAGEIVGRLNER